MENLIIALSLLVGLAGLVVVGWSYADTRSKYYKDYMDRKRSK